MIVIDNILFSDEIVEKKFVCDLSKCKGGCCEQGDAGAPLDESELEIIVALYPLIKKYLTADAIIEIERNGLYHYNKEFGWVTPTLANDNEICAYGFRDQKGIIQCAFEKAFADGKTNWKKPISCHLFPIRIKKSKDKTKEYVNYEAHEEREGLCNPACKLGKKLSVPVFEFLKEPIVRKYGNKVYETLEQIAADYFEASNIKHTI